jgi:hypothetical protein
VALREAVHFLHSEYLGLFPWTYKGWGLNLNPQFHLVHVLPNRVLRSENKDKGKHKYVHVHVMKSYTGKG